MKSLIFTIYKLKKAQQYFILLVLFILASCQLDPIFDDDIERFNKIYAVTQNVEAIDVVEKMDGSGYLIIGHIKSITDSDIIIIDAGLDGMQRNYHRIDTDKYDEAVALKIHEADQSIFILGNRREDPSSNEYFNILLKANLEGNPVQADTTYVVKELDTISGYSIKMNDFLINSPHIIFAGQIRQNSGNTISKFNQIYEIESFNFNNNSTELVKKLNQNPIALSSLTPDTRNLQIDKSDFPGAVYSVYGQSDQQNPLTTPIWEIITDLETQSGLIPDLKPKSNWEYGFAINHSNNKTYLAGNFKDLDSLFLISAEYPNTETSVARIELNDSIYGIHESVGSQKRVSSLIEDLDGNIIMAAYVVEQSNTENSTSYLLKFSPSTDQIEGQQVVFNSTGQKNIRKLILASDGSVLLLSQLIFENNSMAIGLTKIKF